MMGVDSGQCVFLVAFTPPNVETTADCFIGFVLHTFVSVPCFFKVIFFSHSPNTLIVVLMYGCDLIMASFIILGLGYNSKANNLFSLS